MKNSLKLFILFYSPTMKTNRTNNLSLTKQSVGMKL